MARMDANQHDNLSSTGIIRCAHYGQHECQNDEIVSSSCSKNVLHLGRGKPLTQSAFSRGESERTPFLRIADLSFQIEGPVVATRSHTRR